MSSPSPRLHPPPSPPKHYQLRSATARAPFAPRYYDPQIPTDEYGVKETEPIGWLAAAMQQQNSEMPAVAMQEAVSEEREERRDKKKQRRIRGTSMKQ